MSKSKKLKFDPLSMRATHEKQHRMAATYQEAYDLFARNVDRFSHDILENFNSSSRGQEVLLVHLFGLQGVERIKYAVQHIPKEVPLSERIYFIRNILEFTLPGITLSDSTITILMNHFDNYCEDDNSIKLRTLSEMSGTAYTSFLAPPTSSCLNRTCKNFNCPGSLYQHHPPITVSLFTFEGPQPATKISLKCRGCSTIYNYNMFGNKKSEGERFYDAAREYVEISDVAYCSQELLQMYTLLRLGILHNVTVTVFQILSLLQFT